VRDKIETDGRRRLENDVRNPPASASPTSPLMLVQDQMYVRLNCVQYLLSATVLGAPPCFCAFELFIRTLLLQNYPGGKPDVATRLSISPFLWRMCATLRETRLGDRCGAEVVKTPSVL
jgi:hypothetical protein